MKRMTWLWILVICAFPVLIITNDWHLLYTFKVRLQFLELKLKVFIDISNSNFLLEEGAIQFLSWLT